MEQALSVTTFSNGEEDKRLVECNNVGNEDIYMTVYVMRIVGLMVIVVIH